MIEILPGRRVYAKHRNLYTESLLPESLDTHRFDEARSRPGARSDFQKFDEFQRFTAIACTRAAKPDSEIGNDIEDRRGISDCLACPVPWILESAVDNSEFWTAAAAIGQFVAAAVALGIALWTWKRENDRRKEERELRARTVAFRRTQDSWQVESLFACLGRERDDFSRRRKRAHLMFLVFRFWTKCCSSHWTSASH